MERLNGLGYSLLAGLLFFVGCAGRAPEPAPVVAPTLYEWHPEGLSGKTRVVIDLPRQVAEVTIGGERAGWATVATGKEGYATPGGDFTIVEKVVDKYSTLYGKTVDADGNTVNPDADIRKDRPPRGGKFVGAPMPYWMRITWRGVGMHAGHIPNPGEPASHGCIRLPKDFAPLLFDAVVIGTPVRIIR